MAKSDRICSVDGCGKKARGKGWCSAHYTRFRRYGDPLGQSPAYNPISEGETCAVEGCLKPQAAKGWCRSHYLRWYRYGTPLGRGEKNNHFHSGACGVDGCKEPYMAKGYCRAHYSKMWRYGDPVQDVRSHVPEGAHLEWIKAHSTYNERGCLIWPFRRNKKGYAVCSIDGRFTMAYRAMCEVVNGAPPSAEHQAAHSCGEGHKGCVNPTHLRWATAQENADDRILHGRSCRGEESAVAKLTSDDIREIRASTEDSRVVAAKYGIVRDYVYDIRNLKTWQHLD